MKVSRFPKSISDLIEIADHLAENDVRVADRFFDLFEETIDIIKRTPKIGSTRYSDQYGEIRMWFDKDFERVLVFYKASETEVLILRVIHSARDYTALI